MRPPCKSLTQLKAVRPHPRNYPQMPTDYRHKDNHLRRESSERQTDTHLHKRTDGRYQAHYLPALRSIKTHRFSWWQFKAVKKFALLKNQGRICRALKGVFGILGSQGKNWDDRKAVKSMHPLPKLQLLDYTPFEIGITGLQKSPVQGPNGE